MNEGGDLLQNARHALRGVDGGVDFVMMRESLHDHSLGSGVGLSDHVRQVMAIVLGQRGTEDDQVKSIAAQGFKYALAV